MFRVWGLNMLMLEGGIVGSIKLKINDVSIRGFPHASIVAVSEKKLCKGFTQATPTNPFTSIVD